MLPLINKRFVFSLLAALFFVAAIAFLTAGRAASPQAQTISVVNNKESANKIPANSASAGMTETVLFKSTTANSTAATRNADYKMNLAWTFGGKTQRGWYLYEPLIYQLINFDVKESDFSANLLGWQKKAGLIANGELDETSLAAMVKTWQSQRLKSLAHAAPDELLTAPAAEFWDSSRPAELRQVERETYTAYKKLLAAAIADKSLNLKTNPDGTLAESEKFFKIISAFRSREYQLKLRQAEPNASRAALAVHSPHFTGRALDIYVGGEPVTTKDDNRLVQINTPAYRWLVRNAHKFGFRPYFYEPWHWEYVGVEAAK